jgi:coenzyme F420 hydrogenase subunit beta
MRLTNQTFVPRITLDKCTSCGLCVQSCPGYSVDFHALTAQVFGRNGDDPGIGQVLDCYVGYAADRDVRYASASGGVATALLAFALENDVIDGALVTRMRRDNPLEPEAFVAHSVDEIRSAARSKYSPVAANVALRAIAREPGRFAVVGLPCHIHGLRKAAAASPVVQKRVVLCIGLLCSHMVAFAGIYHLLRKLRVDAARVRSISYRGEGWPGGLTIQLDRGESRRLPLTNSWHGYWSLFSSFFFTPTRCTMCPDQAAELADISLGDAWLPEFRSDHLGRSLVISRTAAGQHLLERAREARVVQLQPVAADKVWQSQRVNLTFKKADLPQRLALLRRFGQTTPRFTPPPQGPTSVVTWLRNVFVCGNVYAASRQFWRWMWVHAPLPLFRLYYGLYRLLSQG